MFWEKTFYSSSNGFIGKVFCIFVISICLTVQCAYSQTTEPKDTPKATSLELGKPIEREISGEQKHLYKVKLPAKQFVKIDVEQRGIDIVAQLLDKDGQLLTHYDLNPRNKGTEELIITSDVAGEYQISIEPSQKTLPNGCYEIHFIESRTATEKEFAIDKTRRLYTKGNNLWRSRKLDEALEAANQSLKIWEEEIGEDDPEYYRVYLLLGNIYNSKGDYEKSESFYTKALELNEKTFGENHITIHSLLNNFGAIYLQRGNYPKAEEFLERTLKIREKELEPNHLLTASILNNLGVLNRAKGDNKKAEIFYLRALEIREKALGSQHHEVAKLLNNIGEMFAGSDDEKAELYLSKSLAISEEIFGSKHPELAQPLYELAYVISRKKNYEKAVSLCKRSLSIFEKEFGSEHPLTSYSLNLLATLYKSTGEYEKAETLYKRAINIKQKTEGKYHPSLQDAYMDLTALYAVQGDIEKAVDVQEKANAIYEHGLGLNLSVGSEQDKLKYIKTQEDKENQILSLNFQVGSNSQAATNLGASLVLQRKGRVLDAMSNNLGALRRRFNKEDQKMLEDLNNTTKELVDFILAGPKKLNAEEYQLKIEELEKKRENLEDRVSQRSLGFYTQTKPITLESIKRIIPPKSALVEFSLYYPANPELYGIGKKTSDKPQEPRLIVYIISAENEVQGKDLGEVKEIDAAIIAYRKALADPKRKDIKELGRLVDEKIMNPIRSLLSDSTHLLISPDGLLNLMPFEALVDEKGKYLVENYSLSYLTSGRDLLRMKVARESKTKPVLVANPSFGEPLYNAEANSKITIDTRRSITATRDISETYFAPLDGTEKEADLIKTLFPEATLLDEAKATETALKQVTSPNILHIATHGFFLEDIENGVNNPLLRSGLAFAGANQRKSGEDDGILTALEASGLNLWGTKLVVLSACDTGLGEVKNGEGVYGLRRSFTLAGTESLVMSLWSVSDYVTRELMIEYYKNLKKGMGRNEALREVQLKMIKKKNRQHPFYWASFIQSGEWANLEGKR